MKFTIIATTALTGLLIFSTVVCGLWIKGQEAVDPSSVSFHMSIALLTVLFTVLTLVLTVGRAIKFVG